MSRAFLSHRGRRTPHLTGVALTLVLTLLCSVVGVTALTPAAHATSHAMPQADTATEPADTDTPNADTDADPEPTVTLTLAPTQPVLLNDDREFQFVATLTNDTDIALPRSALSLGIETTPVTDTAALSAAPDAASAQTFSLTNVTEVAAGATRDISVTVPRADLPLTAESPAGVYRLTAELKEQPETSDIVAAADPLVTAAAAPITWQGIPADRSAAVTFVVPLLLPQSISVMPTREQLAAAAPQLQATLEAATTAQATLAVDPRILAGIRAYGTAAPTAAQTFLSALVATELPVFLLQYSDADPAAQAALGASSLLRPEGFRFVTRNGAFPTPQPAADPATGTSDADSEPVSDEPNTSGPAEASPKTIQPERAPEPTVTELQQLDQAYPGAWPAEGQIDRATLDLLRASELTSLIVSSDTVPQATTAKVTFQGFSALVSDKRLSQLTTEWLNAPNDTTRSAVTARLYAELTLRNQISGGSDAVIALDRSAATHTNRVPGLLQTTLSLPGVIPKSERDLSSSETAYEANAPLEERVEMLRAQETTSEQITDLAVLLTTPQYLHEYQRMRLLYAYSAQFATPETDLAAVNAALSKRDESFLQGVEAVSTDNTHLIGVSSNIPITLHNHLPFQAQVTVTANPGSAAIEVPRQDSEIITVPARGNAVHSVTVESRVSSGESHLLVEVRDRTDTETFARLDMRLTLRSSYETVLLVVVGASALLLLVAGIWRSVRQRHRSERPDTETVDAEPQVHTFRE